MGYYGLLDRTPMGRNEQGEQVLWLRRHNEYETSDPKIHGGWAGGSTRRSAAEPGPGGSMGAC
jgi:hypothetical protein